MRDFAKTMLCAVLVGASVPAAAAQVVFSGGTASGTNGRIFTAGSGSEAISVRVSAWTLNGSTVNASVLGLHGTAGLGIRNAIEGTSSQASANASHTIDNLNRTDFLILQFDKKVVLGNATFTAYKQSGYNYTDTDATIGWGNTATAWNSQLSLTTLANLNSLIPAGSRYASGNNGSQGTNTRNIDPLLYSGNVWIVSSAIGSHNADGKIDSFKFNNLNYTTKMPVPEPATWMMMIAGFGFIGSVLRRRKAVVGVARADASAPVG